MQYSEFSLLKKLLRKIQHTGQEARSETGVLTIPRKQPSEKLQRAFTTSHEVAKALRALANEIDEEAARLETLLVDEQDVLSPAPTNGTPANGAAHPEGGGHA